MTRATDRDEIVGMIAFGLDPIEDMMNIKLADILGGFSADDAFVAVTAPHQFADRFPSSAPIPYSSPLPVRGPVTSTAVHGISGTAALYAEAGGRFGCVLWRRIEFGVRCAMLAITGLIAEQTASMGLFALVDLSALGAFDFDAALPEVRVAASSAESWNTYGIIGAAEFYAALFTDIGHH